MLCTLRSWSFVLLLLSSSAISALSFTERVATVFAKNYISSDSSTKCDGADCQEFLYPTRFPGVTWDYDNWRLATTTLDQGHYQSRGSIANGYIGINVAAVGPFFELDTAVNGDVINGWPLYSRRQTFATISGFYDLQPTTNGSNFPWMNQYGGESVISGVPHWSGLVLDLGNNEYLDSSVTVDEISNFKSTLDMKGGLLNWEYTWSPIGREESFAISYQLFAHRLNVTQAVVRMAITPSADMNVRVVNVIDGYSAVRTEFVDSGEDGHAIYSSVSPVGVPDVTAYIYATMSGSKEVDIESLKLVPNPPYVHTNRSSIAQAADIKLRAGQKSIVTKFVGIASSDGFENPKQVAKEASSNAADVGYEALLKSHIGEWAAVFTDDSVDDFAVPKTGRLPLDDHIIESAITSVTNPFYLLQAIVSDNAIHVARNAPIHQGSVAVGGLTSDSYGGLIFWDADIWMQPGLVTAFPQAAQSFTNYRLIKYGQAIENTKTAFASSKNQTRFSQGAAIYPWTSGRFGNCTGTGPCFDYQYHLNGDIGLQMINNWVTTGDTDHFKEKLLPVYNSIAILYADLLEKNGTKWTLTNMTDPDEYANHVDGGGFTLPMMATTLIYANSLRQMFGFEQNVTWNEMAENILVLRDPVADVTLEYTTMNGSTRVKQADIVLNTFPLRYTDGYSPQNALGDLDYYAAKQSPDGPGMTYAIFSIVANEISPSGCSAYTYAQYSYAPYIRAPFFQFSEQLIDNWSRNGGTHPAYPFLTGNGGANQVALFGYLGLRLLPDFVLHLDPNLPPQIPHLSYRTFYWHGWPLKAASNYTHTTIQRAPNTQPLPIAAKKFAGAPIPVHVGPESNVTVYLLPAFGILTIPNRQIGSHATFPGNMVQCQPASSPDEYEPGQFPIAAIDGAASTKWQPKRANATSSLTVSFPDDEISELITGFGFDWAQAPPESIAVVLHNTPLSKPTQQQVSQSFSPSSASGALSVPSTPGAITVTAFPSITLSNPYNPATTDLNIIARYTGNTTNVTLARPVPATRFATLFMWGNQALDNVDRRAGNGSGATVAEWSILRALRAGQSGTTADRGGGEEGKFKVRGG
ncbi:glycosyl hydrolase [Histoplasma capsulatum]|uniref:alpha,alpha-trehalase n=1 Tax=Ajellomyces capsulatus TaxID=5037 RepID=A0A8A1MQ89_AJECA|nr:acid trehalase precursor [Histoplasma mississippiense (nom. inval.)]EDN11126.1 acid trehalase precursor [Histoplasma mississippiense (nom. inval.)]QSS66944.1 glycosyl hydrolase [Histoplasma capsulatum]